MATCRKTPCRAMRGRRKTPAICGSGTAPNGSTAARRGGRRASRESRVPTSSVSRPARYDFVDRHRRQAGDVPADRADPVDRCQRQAGDLPADAADCTVDVTGLVAGQAAQDTAIAGKAPTVHTHAQADVTNLVSDLALKAPLANPTFTGDPKAPTPATADNDTSIATTAYVKANLATIVGGAIISDTAPGRLKLDNFGSRATAATPSSGTMTATPRSGCRSMSRRRSTDHSRLDLRRSLLRLQDRAEPLGLERQGRRHRHRCRDD